MMKKFSAIIAAAALAVTMTVTVSATTYRDAVQAARDVGVQSNNVQELDNFLQVHKDCFTSAQYDEMIASMRQLGETYINPYCRGGDRQLYDKTAAELTEDDKIQIGQNWSQEERQDIIDTLVELGRDYDVTITVTQVDYAHYTVAAEHLHRDSSGNVQPGGTTVVADNPVAATGAAAKASDAAPIAAGVALAAAGLGVVVIAKKNKA